MGAEILKKEIWESLDNLSEKYLKVIHTLIKNLQEDETDWWTELDDETKKSIEKSIEEIDKGEGISHDEVMADLRKKYGKV